MFSNSIEITEKLKARNLTSKVLNTKKISRKGVEFSKEELKS